MRLRSALKFNFKLVELQRLIITSVDTFLINHSLSLFQKIIITVTSDSAVYNLGNMYIVSTLFKVYCYIEIPLHTTGQGNYGIYSTNGGLRTITRGYLARVTYLFNRSI